MGVMCRVQHKRRVKTVIQMVVLNETIDQLARSLLVTRIRRRFVDTEVEGSSPQLYQHVVSLRARHFIHIASVDSAD